MTVLTHAPAASVSPRPADVLELTAAFWNAHNRAESIRADLTREQCAGVAPLPAGLEYWDGEARTRHEAVLDLVGPGEVFGSLDGLYSRPRVTEPVVTSESSWTRGRTA